MKQIKLIAIISKADMKGFDLNLLTSLEALLAERNVTRAAERLSLSQSAMSYNLARLRTLFGDEILTRVPGGMKPTPFALTLMAPLGDVLAHIGELVERETDFVPSQASMTFRIALPDSSEVLLIPSLLARLQQEAPGIQLDLRVLNGAGVLDALDDGSLHMAVGAFADGQVHHKRQLLVSDDHLCLFNPALLSLSNPLDIEEFLALPHAVQTVQPPARDLVDDALLRIDRKRLVTMRTPHVLSLPLIVLQAPILATVHGVLARYYAALLGLEVRLPPIDLPKAPISLLWHSSHDKNSAHRWLRGMIRQTMRHLKTFDIPPHAQLPR